MTAVAADLGPAAPVSEPALAPHDAPTLSPDLASDPHAAPKMAPDDPRLALRRGGGRTLRTGPLLALALSLSGAVVLAVAFAFDKPAHSPRAEETAPTSKGPAAPVVPDAIRNAPSAPPASVAAHRQAAAVEPTRTQAVGLASDDKPAVDRGLQAEMAPILFGRAPGGGDQPPPPEVPRSASPEAHAGSSLPSSDLDPNLQGRKNAFVAGEGSPKGGDSSAAIVQHPVSPYELLAGTIIPAVLLTAINSDLPGPVIGQVRQAVYDTVTGNTLLVPQGARLLASYDSMVAWGQERVLLCWNRLLFPDGDSVDLSCMPAADLAGAAGLTDSVDEHWFRIVKGAAVASLLAATTQGIAGSTTGFNPTVPQLWASNAAGDINQVGQQLTRRNLTIQPTITVRPGYSVNVMVTRDLVLPPYPDAALAGGLRR